MRVLKFLGGLVAAVLLHFAGARLAPPFPAAVDAFLVVAVLNALGGHLLGAMAGGALAGLLSDALSGGPFGLHGFADTMVAYATAFAARRLVIESSVGVFALAALASAAQQAVVTGLMLALFPIPLVPALPWIGAKMASSGLLALAAVRLAGRVTSGAERRRQARRSRLTVD